MTGHIYEIDVPMVMRGRPLSLNDRLHWRAKADHVRTIREAVAWSAKSLRLGQLAHATIQLHYAPGRGGKHDADNLVATSKPAVDGLRDAGVTVFPLIKAMVNPLTGDAVEITRISPFDWGKP